MNCLDARRALGAEPHVRTPELEAHLAGCAACARHAEELARFDALLLEALRVPVPSVTPGATRVAAPSIPVPLRRGWGALAAVAATVVIGLSVWLAQPREALASALVEHMAHEPEAWTRTDVAVSSARLRPVLASAGLELAEDGPKVSYVMSCFFRGRYVPHLVVQTDAGPVTVMILPREHVVERATFDEGGYRGVIVPARHGSLALLAKSQMSAGDLDATLARLQGALHFRD
jgi:hypothetical protein